MLSADMPCPSAARAFCARAMATTPITSMTKEDFFNPGIRFIQNSRARPDLGGRLVSVRRLLDVCGDGTLLADDLSAVGVGDLLACSRPSHDSIHNGQLRLCQAVA